MTVMRRRRARCSADANGAGAGSRSREPDDIFTPPAFRPSNFLTQPVVRYPTNDKVAIENDGDIELDTGTVASAKVLTTADIFVDGSTEGLLAQLTSVTSRLAAAEAKLAALVICKPPGGFLAYDGANFHCTCGFGYSGAQCDTPPSISKLEPTTVSKIFAAEPILDSGSSDSDHDLTKSADQDTSTGWKPDWQGVAEIFIVFNLQQPVEVKGLSVCAGGSHGITGFTFSYDPNHSGSGPWTEAFTSDINRACHYSEVSLPQQVQYIRLGRIQMQLETTRYWGWNEVEFFEPNIGDRVE